MRSKLPLDAFTYYASLGPERSYSAVAAYFKVDRKTVIRRATAEGWQTKVADLERQALERTKQKIVFDLDEMNQRHLKILRVVMNKALEALRAMPLKTGADAVRAIDLCVRHERLILGDPADSQAESIEDITRKEFARWMAKGEPDDAASDSSEVRSPRSVDAGSADDPRDGGGSDEDGDEEDDDETP